MDINRISLSGEQDGFRIELGEETYEFVREDEMATYLGDGAIPDEVEDAMLDYAEEVVAPDVERLGLDGEGGGTIDAGELVVEDDEGAENRLSGVERVFRELLDDYSGYPDDYEESASAFFGAADTVEVEALDGELHISVDDDGTGGVDVEYTGDGYPDVSEVIESEMKFEAEGVFDSGAYVVAIPEDGGGQETLMLLDVDDVTGQGEMQFGVRGDFRDIPLTKDELNGKRMRVRAGVESYDEESDQLVGFANLIDAETGEVLVESQNDNIVNADTAGDEYLNRLIYSMNTAGGEASVEQGAIDQIDADVTSVIPKSRIDVSDLPDSPHGDDDHEILYSRDVEIQNQYQIFDGDELRLSGMPALFRVVGIGSNPIVGLENDNTDVERRFVSAILYATDTSTEDVTEVEFGTVASTVSDESPVDAVYAHPDDGFVAEILFDTEDEEWYIVPLSNQPHDRQMHEGAQFETADLTTLDTSEVEDNEYYHHDGTDDASTNPEGLAYYDSAQDAFVSVVDGGVIE